MTKETQQQIAQRLWDKGRLNMEDGLFATVNPDYALENGYDPAAFWKEPKHYIEHLCKTFDREYLSEELHEAYAALAALDGSIPVWRDAEREEPPKDGYYFVQIGGITSLVRFSKEVKWFAADVTHWTYPPVALETKG